MEAVTGICFVAGTKVMTKEGLVPIEEIRAGDTVLSRDEGGGDFEWCSVLRTFVRHDQPIVEVSLEDEGGKLEKIGATPEHPFWVKEQGWVGAGELLPGDEVFSSLGGWVRVTGSTWVSGKQTVYNFEVDKLHTYFVGESGAWVHNQCMGPKSELITVRTYTGAAGREGITRSGVLNANTWVTLPGEIPSRAGHLQIEKLLEIKPGRGTNFLEFQVPSSNLRIPANGATTSGGAWQRQLIEPTPIDPDTFRRPPGRPLG